MKSGERDPLDRYYTPLPFSRAHVRRLIELGLLQDGYIVMDAGCGDGSYLEALDLEIERAGLKNVKVFGIDIDKAAVETCIKRGKKAIHDSFLDVDGLKAGEIQLVVGNPPFLLAKQFIDHGLMLGEQNRDHMGVVSFLLQSQYLSGSDRYESDVWDGLVRADPFTTRPRFYGPAVDLINERRKAEGKPKAGGNTVDYSTFTWTTERNRKTKASGQKPSHDILARHLVPIVEPASRFTATVA